MTVSNCCSAPILENCDVCSDCKEHCESVVPEPTHTAGPWTVKQDATKDRLHPIVIDDTGFVVCTPHINARNILNRSDHERLKEVCANAFLIAAAPRQNEALEGIFNDCDKWLNGEMDIAATDLLTAIRQVAEQMTALAKAGSPSSHS